MMTMNYMIIKQIILLNIIDIIYIIYNFINVAIFEIVDLYFVNCDFSFFY